MKIKTIIFGESSNPANVKLESVVCHAFSDLSGKTMEPPNTYDNLQQGMPEIASALKTSDMIVIFADQVLYHEAKRCICKAFKFEMIHHEKILKLLSRIQNSERYMLHALMPKNAIAFPLSDGLFSGFAIRSKKQCIFFLPYSEDRTFLTIKKYVFPYISRIYGATLPSFNEYETAYSAAIFKKHIEMSDIQIAVANTPFCKQLAKAGKKIECFNDHISFAPYDEEKSSKKSVQQIASEAAEYYECTYGAAVIECENDDCGNYTASIVISNRKTATIRTISSIPDENHDDFINTLICEFFLMLTYELKNSKSDNDNLKNEDVLKPKPAVRGYHILVYIVLLATVFFATYVAASTPDPTLFF